MMPTVYALLDSIGAEKPLNTSCVPWGKSPLSSFPVVRDCTPALPCKHENLNEIYSINGLIQNYRHRRQTSLLVTNVQSSDFRYDVLSTQDDE